jgi:hypothetical protein
MQGGKLISFEIFAEALLKAAKMIGNVLATELSKARLRIAN